MKNDIRTVNAPCQIALGKTFFQVLRQDKEGSFTISALMISMMSQSTFGGYFSDYKQRSRELFFSPHSTKQAPQGLLLSASYHAALAALP
jgi:hypothetical protein